jgi:hypothetical protein
VGTDETGLELVHRSDTTAILIGTALSGVDLGGSCQVPGRGAAVFFIEGNICTGAVGLDVPAGTLTFKGVAGTTTDLWILANFVVQESNSTISSLPAPAGAVLIRLVDASVVDVVGVPGLEPIAMVAVGERLAIAGRVLAGGTVPWVATAPASGHAIVGLYDGNFTSAVAFRGSDVEVTALAAHGQRVLVGGHWRNTLLVDGGSPIDSTSLTEGFVVELGADDAGTLTLTRLRPLQGDSDDRIHGLFIDERSFGFLSSAIEASRFGEAEIGSGLNITTATLRASCGEACRSTSAPAAAPSPSDVAAGRPSPSSASGPAQEVRSKASSMCSGRRRDPSFRSRRCGVRQPRQGPPSGAPTTATATAATSPPAPSARRRRRRRPPPPTRPAGPRASAGTGRP